MKKIDFITRYNNSKLTQVLIFSILNIFLLPFVLIWLIIKPIYNIQFIRITDSRIGHLAANTDLFLRRLNNNVLYQKNVIYLAIASKNPCNYHLLNMFKRKIKMIQIPTSIYNNYLFRALSSNKSVFGFFNIYNELTFNYEEFPEFNLLKPTKPNLEFTNLEEMDGKKLLQNMGIDEWFICFHARDSAYLNNRFNGDKYHEYRNCDINKFLKAANYITTEGGYALRMGAIVNKKLPHLKNNKIIDYATQYRTDFGDIYLLAKCKFFLADTAGILLVSVIFNIPVAATNMTHWGYLPLKKGDLFIPKKVWSIKEERYLTLNELVDKDIINFSFKKQYDKAGLVIIENTTKEILDLAIEMNQRLDGKWNSTPQDNELQRKFKNIFLKRKNKIYNVEAKIGTMFLRENKELLE